MKKYERPEIEISVFTTEDIITSSSVVNTPALVKGADLKDNTPGTDYDDLF